MFENGNHEECPLPHIELGYGIVPGNPTFCMRCLQPIREGENWTKYFSEDDPEFGRYCFLVHSICPDWEDPPEDSFTHPDGYSN
jgi:hypothetical protein